MISTGRLTRKSAGILADPQAERGTKAKGSTTGRMEHVMRKVLRGYAKDRDGKLILIGTVPAPHSKDKASPSERRDKRRLIRQGATIFKREIAR